MYTGKFVNGLYHGDGILYNPDSTIKFQGMFADGYALI